jgi:hypothetical protein
LWHMVFSPVTHLETLRNYATNFTTLTSVLQFFATLL